MATDYEKAVTALMKDVIAAVKAVARSRVDDAKESLGESAAHRLEQVREAAEAIGQNCKERMKTCAEKIEEHPLGSVLAALGAGVVMGLLIRCHRR